MHAGSESGTPRHDEVSIARLIQPGECRDANRDADAPPTDAATKQRIDQRTLPLPASPGNGIRGVPAVTGVWLVVGGGPRQPSHPGTHSRRPADRVDGQQGLVALARVDHSEGIASMAGCALE
jgi:hypothetical protein